MLTIRGVSLYRGARALVKNVSFQVNKSDVVTVMGPSGSEESLLFSWMIGTLSPQFQPSGELWLNGRRIDTLLTTQRQIDILFQDALLFDHFNVGQNLLLALPARLQGPARRHEVESAPAHADLAGFYSHNPASLSGGQCPRIALLHALLAQPRALLLNESFSRLDAPLRDNFHQWIFTEACRLGIPVVQVTHDAQDVPSTDRILQAENQA